MAVTRKLEKVVAQIECVSLNEETLEETFKVKSLPRLQLDAGVDDIKAICDLVGPMLAIDVTGQQYITDSSDLHM